MSLVGKKVKVTFNPSSWPIPHATYTYEGRDEKGHWVRRKDGVQRHILFGDVILIEPVEEEIPEGDF